MGMRLSRIGDRPCVGPMRRAVGQRLLQSRDQRVVFGAVEVSAEHAFAGAGSRLERRGRPASGRRCCPDAHGLLAGSHAVPRSARHADSWRSTRGVSSSPEAARQVHRVRLAAPWAACLRCRGRPARAVGGVAPARRPSASGSCCRTAAHRRPPCGARPRSPRSRGIRAATQPARQIDPRRPSPRDRGSCARLPAGTARQNRPIGARDRRCGANRPAHRPRVPIGCSR